MFFKNVNKKKIKKYSISFSFYDFLWSDPEETKRFGSDRIRIHNTGTNYGSTGRLQDIDIKLDIRPFSSATTNYFKRKIHYILAA